MAVRGKSINLFLMDGDPNGRIKCSLTNWTGIAYKIPRIEIDNSKEIEHLSHNGVYFLFGTSDKGDSVVYIGQARTRKNGNGLLGRIIEPHPAIDYWTDAVLLTTRDDYFGPTEISYLENRFCNMAKEVGRYPVVNGNDPSPGKITEEKESEMEEFIDYSLIVIGALGYKLFTPIVVPKINSFTDNEPTLYMQKGDVTASGIRTPEGFAVLKGSKLSATLTRSCPENARKYRKQYESKIDKNFVLLEDILVSSPSSAAAFVGGTSISGNEAWKTKDGVSIKKMESYK
jgi:hypothetical protein